MACRRPTSAPTDGATAVALQADGRIVVGGSSGGDFALARYDAAARSTRRSAAMASRPPTSVGSTPATTWRSAPTARSSLVGTHAFGVRRTSPWPATPPGGALDRRSVARRPPTSAAASPPTTAAKASRSRPTAASSSWATAQSQTQFGGYYTRDLQLARYETNGALDRSFSDDGRLETSFYAETLGYGVALESNGRIVAFGKAGERIRARPLQHRRHARRHASPTTASRPPRPRSPSTTSPVSTASCRPTASWWSSGPRPAATSRSRASTATRRTPTRRVPTHRTRNSPEVRPGRRT